MGELKRHLVRVLIDLGNTHNFISLWATQYVNLQSNSNSKLEVLMTSRKKLMSPIHSLQVPIKLQEVPFEVDFFILPFEGYDIVLGT